MSQPIRGQGGHFVFSWIAWKTQTWQKALRACFLSSFVEFYSTVSEEKLKMSQQIIGQGGHFVFPIHLKNTNLVEGVEILLPIKFRRIPFTVSEEKSKMSQPIRGQGSHLVFPISPKNTNLVEAVEIFLPIKFHWIPFSGFREVENVSANQRPGRPSCFSNRPEKHKLGRGRLDLVSCQVSLNSIQRFQRRSRKYLSQSEARRPSCFSDQSEKHKLGRGCWDLASCLDSLNSVQRFLQRSRLRWAKKKFELPNLFFSSTLPETDKNFNLASQLSYLSTWSTLIVTVSHKVHM